MADIPQEFMTVLQQIANLPISAQAQLPDEIKKLIPVAMKLTQLQASAETKQRMAQLSMQRDLAKENEKRTTIEFRTNQQIAAEQRTNAEARSRVLELTTAGNRLAVFGPENPEFKSVIHQLVDDPQLLAQGGLESAANLTIKAKSSIRYGTGRLYRYYSAELSKQGIDPPTDMAQQIADRITKNQSVRQYVAEVRDKHSAEQKVKVEAGQRKLEEAKTVRNLVSQGVKLKDVGTVMDAMKAEEGLHATDPRRGLALSEATARSRRGGMLKGAAGVALLAFLGSKLFGGKEQGGSQLPPEMQMALAAQLQRSQGAGDDGKAFGRDLTNTSRLLGIIKMLQGMQGMQSAEPVNAGMIV